jgi:histidinol-phosphate aminotransferase
LAGSRFRRPSLGPDFGYTPGEQPPDGDGWLKLNTNESPLPPSPAVAEAVAGSAADLHRYPSPDGEPLRSALARYHGVEPGQVMVANGADEVLDCCIRAFCEPGSRLVLSRPTYAVLPILGRIFGTEVVELAAEEDGTLPAALGTTAGALRFAVNPNAPTGVWTPPDALEELLTGASGVTVIDEAYCDFAPASCLPLLGRHDDWLVVRTFSKAHALAGLRVGYAVGDARLVADLVAVKDSYPVDRCAIAGAMAALADEAHHQAIVTLVRRERDRVSARLLAAGWSVLPSQANFVLARPPDGAATEAATRLRRERILVRHFGDGPHADRLRITIGTAADNDRLLQALAG